MNTQPYLAAFRRIAVALVLLPVLAALSLRAQTTPNPPGQISYQGFLVDANGLALATNAPVNYDVIFRLWTASSGGSNLWAELQTVTVDRGYFSVMLGQGSSFDVPWTNNLTSFFTNLDASDRYVEITVRGLPGGDTVIQPRLRLLASPYSFLAFDSRNSDRLQGYDWSSVFTDTGNPITGTIPGSKIAAGAIGATQIAAGAVGSAQIASNAVGAAQIAAGAVGATQIAAGAVGNSQIAAGSVSDYQLSPPLSLSANASGFYWFGGYDPGYVLSLTNTSTGLFAGDGLIVGGATAIAAYSQSGTRAYIAGSSGSSFYGTSGNGTSATLAGTSGGAFSISGYSANLANSTSAATFNNSAGPTATLAGGYGGVFQNGTGIAYLGAGVWSAFFYGGPVYMDQGLSVHGTLSKSAGSFKIDHPLDPANKYLYHSFVESPDMKNIYDGVIVLDAQGEAVVEMPTWFQALNQDFRYQLTAMGGPGPNLYIAEEVSQNHFKIAGGAAGLKVSWQVTGVRHDAYANAHRIPIEEDKAAELRGSYLHPVEYGQPAEKGISPLAEAKATTSQK